MHRLVCFLHFLFCHRVRHCLPRAFLTQRSWYIVQELAVKFPQDEVREGKDLGYVCLCHLRQIGKHSAPVLYHRVFAHRFL